MTTDEALVRTDADIEVTLAGMDAVHTLLDHFWREIARSNVTPPGDIAETLFASAVAEIAGNIVRHAYPTPADATFHVTLACFADRLQAVMIDWGGPYEYAPSSRVPDMRTALDDPELDHGWGLPIAHAASDNLRYERLPDGTNRWCVEKRFPV